MLNIKDEARRIITETLPTRGKITDDASLESLGANETDRRVVLMELEDALKIKFDVNYKPTTIGDIITHVADYSP